MALIKSCLASATPDELSSSGGSTVTGSVASLNISCAVGDLIIVTFFADQNFISNASGATLVNEVTGSSNSYKSALYKATSDTVTLTLSTSAGALYQVITS